jgi:hypothetical protein
MKIQVTLDAKKLRNLVSKRSYNNNQGEAVEIQEVKFDLVELSDDKKKEIYNAEKYLLVKTHFAVAQQTKEEREAKADPFFVGEGISMVWKNDTSTANVSDADDGDLPF